MTPREKAKEIIEKFTDKVNPYIGSGMLSNTRDDSAILWQSKKCANIVCDEILKTIKRDSDFTTTYNNAKTYWNDVKSEIDSFTLADA